MKLSICALTRLICRVSFPYTPPGSSHREVSTGIQVKDDL